MEPTFRKSMAWLHTWAGVVVGSVLFAVFWMGSLSVFDREIDRWMMPASRIPPAVARLPVRLDGPVALQIEALTAGAPQWLLHLPDERSPVIELHWLDAGKKAFEERQLHPQTGAPLRQGETLAASDFIYPFHISLHLKWLSIGYWLVGLAAMAMLLLVVSGVVVHRKIFASFFLFRPKKRLQRASLDLHNLAGVLGLPFHFVIAFSGLVLFVSVYWPTAILGVYGSGAAAVKAFSADAYDTYSRPKAGRAATAAASLDRMRADATAAWNGAPPDYLRVWHPGDANSYVELRRGRADTITLRMDQIVFDAATGAELHRYTPRPVLNAQRFVGGLHMVQFRHGLLRWLYFAAGLSGCVLIATGFVFWVEARRVSHAKRGLAGVRVVEALAVFSVTGIIAATLVFLVANRLLPEGAAIGATGRAALEVWAFYLAWLAALGHAAWRGRAAWREQSLTISVLALAAVVGNGATTGQPPWVALAEGLWASAGVDLALLATAGVALLAARRLSRSPARTVAAARRDGTVATGRLDHV